MPSEHFKKTVQHLESFRDEMKASGNTPPAVELPTVSAGPLLGTILGDMMAGGLSADDAKTVCNWLIDTIAAEVA